MRNMLEVRSHESLPKRPPTIALMGSPCTGKTWVAANLAARWGLVHVDPRELL